MPLSDREQQVLEQMERALYEEDPRFATTLRGGAEGYARRRRYGLAAAIVIVGLAVVVAGVMLENVPLGVIGFLVMVAGGAYAAAPRRPELGTVQPDGSVRRPSVHPAARAARMRAGLGQAAGPRGGATRVQRPGTFMQRLELRWEERRQRGEL